jgi:hypothetical protein
MRKTSMFIVCSLILATLSTLELNAKKLATLEELMKPQYMAVDDDKLFITERTSVYIYSMKDYRLLKKFGKPGEGPGEFKINPYAGPGLVLYPYPDHLLVNSQGKLSVYSRDGDLIKEMKSPPFVILKHLKNNFVGSGIITKGEEGFFLCVNLFNSKLEKIKQIYLSDIPVNLVSQMNLPYTPFVYRVYKDKIYIPEGMGTINVFDSNGKKLYSINKKYEQLEVDNAYQKRILRWYKKESPLKAFWEVLKKKITFKSHYPALKDLAIDNDRIFLFTYKKQKDLTECIILDLEGNEQKHIFLPFPDVFPLIPICYSIDNNRFYTLLENEDEEMWELHMEEIN